jgi:hypothetical protein
MGMELDANDPEFVSARALCLKRLGQYKKAMWFLLKAQELYSAHGDDESAGQCEQEVQIVQQLLSDSAPGTAEKE